MVEIWSPIYGWESLYEVSNKGRVRSLPREYKRGDVTVHIRGRIIVPQDNGHGHMKVWLKDGNRQKRMYVHRLVADAFLERKDGDEVVNHKDFDPKNNCAENLEWTTRYGNYKYSFDRGRFDRTNAWLDHLKKTLDENMAKQVIGINTKTGERVIYKALNDCTKDGFQPSCVSNCCNGKRRTHKGFVWRFLKEGDQ